jgi:hypothetical protein
MTRRIHVSPRPGLNGKAFPFWQGDRAETIVGQRIAGYPPRKSRVARGPRVASDDPQRLLKRKLTRYHRKLRQATTPERVAHLEAVIAELETALA